MLYAQVKDKGQWPMKWEKCELMVKHLSRMTYSYQLQVEKSMFGTSSQPEFRGVLVKWVPNSITRDMVREVLLETGDPEQMEAALFMLINEAEVASKAAYYKRVSMVP